MIQKVIKFNPIIKDKIWGGHKLQTLLGKELGNLPNGGESWELSAIEGNVSEITSGELKGTKLDQAILLYKGELVGNKVYNQFGTNFPLLIKFIDANDNLSIQVHPNDEMAQKRHNSFGKTEMWYVLHAEPGAKLISGFAKHTDASEYESLVASGEFVNVLGAHEVKRGDIFFMPAGRVHAIGKGVMVAEIQQTSDITYRVFDYNRRDAQGNTRQLHVAEAKEAIDFADLDSGLKPYTLKKNDRTDVVDCQYFHTGVVNVNGTAKRDYSAIDSFVVLMCVKGNANVEGTELRLGETAMIPASVQGISITATEDTELLEVWV